MMIIASRTLILANFVHTWILHDGRMPLMDDDNEPDCFHPLSLATARVMKRLVTPESEPHRDERHEHNGAGNEDKERRDGHLLGRDDDLLDRDAHDRHSLDLKF